MRKEAMPINNPCKAPPANDGGLENCEFYKGLKTYEPAALEALLADRKRDEDKTVADPQTK